MIRLAYLQRGMAVASWHDAAVMATDPDVDDSEAWCWLLALAGRSPVDADGHERRPSSRPPPTELIDQYLPLCRECPERFVVGHLGQSLDGRIATANGASFWVTGPEDIVHNHRMRALFDAVVVGAGTVRHDDPRLTVRRVAGRNPVRVILDPGRRLDARYHVFTDGEAPTLLFCDAACAPAGERLGRAEVVGVAMDDGCLNPRAVLDELAARGLGRVFVEGGGITVSRFLAAGCLHRLQITVAPLIIGSGRPSITLPEIDRLSAGLRPPMRFFRLGDDVLFECRFDA